MIAKKITKIHHQKGLRYTIYQNPRDYPGKVVIRAWVGTDSAGIKAVVDSLAEAREIIPEGLTCIPNNTGHQNTIVESWE